MNEGFPASQGHCEERVSLKDLASMLATRFPEGSELGISDFLDVETVLALALEVGGAKVDASRADRLLSNYHLLRPGPIGRDGHVLQMARRKLLPLSSSGAWRRHLDCYRKDLLADLRFFDAEDDRIVVRERPFGGVDRRPVYLSRLVDGERPENQSASAAPGKTYRYHAKPEASCGEDVGRGTERSVRIPSAIFADAGTQPLPEHKGVREDITVCLEEMVAVALDIGEKTGKTYYAEVLQRVVDQGLFKAVEGREARPSDRIALSRIVNMVGLVGSGKTVFVNVLIVVLARRGYRAVSLLNSVSDVFEATEILRGAGVAASPLVAKGDRIKHLDEIFGQNGSMLLPDDVARYLETPCLIDGLSVGEADACSYSSVPCHGLRSSKGATCVCPYWDMCPSQTMAREAAVSSVVVSTPAGFAHMTVGKERSGFFELVLADFDVVIVDEADRVQVQLDDSFAPKMSFQELIYDSADPTAAAMKRRPSTKMRDLDVERFFDLRQSTEPVAKALLLSVKTKEVAAWNVVKNETFTSLTLLGALEDDGLPNSVFSDLESRISGRKEPNPLLDQAIALSCQGIDEATYEFAFDAYLADKRAELKEPLRARLSFLFKVIRFDEFLRELASASDFLSFKDEPMTELYNFLRFSNVKQQRYLPSSPIGNLFGMRMTDDNDLILFRQFAFGRAFIGSLPWLDTDEEGNPTGPHVLLLSGSSYEPGCLQYHVNKPVDYLLEAQPWVSEKLAASRVCDLGIEQHVSGSGARFRSKNLGIVLSELMTTLRIELDTADSKILIIVNSYTEADDARERLESLFRRAGMAQKVCALVQSPREEKDKFVLRSEVYRFADHPARILVAPAMGIERGFNIVDSAGHSVFGTLVFSVRPMGIPRDVGVRYRRLNGLIESRAGDYPRDLAEFMTEVRTSAWAQWKSFERDELMPPSAWRAAGREIMVRDTVSTLMVAVVQIFGRLARLKDPERPAPHVYFADAAFRGPDDRNVAAFRTLEELERYMRDIMENSDQPAVARALYGPFYEAFRKGIDNGR